MPGAVYLSQAAREQVATAQARLDEHVTSSGDGRCVACGAEGPCAQRRAALRALGRYGRLPARRPGATRPELIPGLPARPGASTFGWFPATSREGR